MSEPKGFGGLERRVDVRDFELGSYQGTAAIPVSFAQPVLNIPVYDQDKYPTCGAHAGAFLDSKLQTDRKGVLKSLSPKYLWKQIKQIDGYPLDDGTDMTSIFKSLVKTGDCDMLVMDNTLGSSLRDYSKISDVTTQIQSNGAQNTIKNYAFSKKPSFDEIKQAIYKNKVVLALVNIGTGWWEPGYDNVLPLKLGEKVGRHFVVLWGYDANKIWFRNSWGKDWGNQGDGYFERDYLQHVLEIGSVLSLPNQFIFTKDMQYGDSNNDVGQLQRRLGVIPDSSWYGPLTRAAVVKYQIAHNVTPSEGYCGPKTRLSLNTSS